MLLRWWCKHAVTYDTYALFMSTQMYIEGIEVVLLCYHAVATGINSREYCSCEPMHAHLHTTNYKQSERSHNSYHPVYTFIIYKFN